MANKKPTIAGLKREVERLTNALVEANTECEISEAKVEAAGLRMLTAKELSENLEVKVDSLSTKMNLLQALVQSRLATISPLPKAKTGCTLQDNQNNQIYLTGYAVNSESTLSDNSTSEQRFLAHLNNELNSLSDNFSMMM